MNNTILRIVGSSLLGGSFLLAVVPTPPSHGRRFELTIQNLTPGQVFSPVLVASHREDVALFELGEESSDGLARLAEEGDNTLLMEELVNRHRVADVQSGTDVLVPGKSETIAFRATSRARYVSLAAMLVQTNDAFVGLNGLELPRGRDEARQLLLAYDAGSERNSESCAFVPGPPCGAAGEHDEREAEGFVHVHNGIHGIGDLAPETFDWRGPVAVVTVCRVD